MTTGSTVSLDGSTSSDADSDLLAYQWEFVSTPAGSAASLSDPASPLPTFAADANGVYVLSLVVTDARGAESDPDYVTVTAATGNSAPVADAGADRNVTTLSTVNIDGSGCSDADGDLLTHQWAFASVPAGSAATLSDAASAMPSFTADVNGVYVLSLVVTDDEGFASAADYVTVTAETGNSAPVANAGDDKNVTTGSMGSLDGSTSSDADGDLLTYQWAFVSVPVGSLAALGDASSALPTFIADMNGVYVLSLVVTDDEGFASAADYVTVTAMTGNSAPMADAGADQNVSTGSLVSLDGTGSLDADVDLLAFQWAFVSVPAGSATSLIAADSPRPTFTADVNGVYVLSLVVTDDEGFASAADYVTVTAETGNSAPVANAGDDKNVTTGSMGSLDGSTSSDADGDLLTYQWAFVSVPAGSSAALDDATSVLPSFMADVNGVYVLSLVVTDDEGFASAADYVTVTATTGNSAPVADAGEDLYLTTGQPVFLYGADSSDADGDLLTYQWVFVSVPAGSSAALDDATSPLPSFTADVNGVYVLSLVVTDDEGFASAPDYVTVTATTGNSAPVADAANDMNVTTGSTVGLYGAASSDADGDLITYLWAFVSKPAGSAAVLSNATSPMPSFTADVNGVYVLSLVVTDDEGFASAPDYVTVTARTGNSAPVADAGADQNATAGSKVTVDAGGSTDADGDPLAYQWAFVSVPPGSTAALNNPNGQTTSFTANVEGIYVLSLVATDDEGFASAPDYLTVTVEKANSAPVANAGPAVNIFGGGAASLAGSGTDADGDPITFQWSFVSKPSGSSAALNSATAQQPKFIADKDGTYVLRLVVNDGKVNSAPSEVTVSAYAMTKVFMWSGSTGYIYVMNTSGVVERSFYLGYAGSIVSPVFNPADGKLYATVSGPGYILRMNPDGTGITTLVSGLSYPWDIDVDPIAGKLYWAEQSGGRIGRCDLDGANVEYVATGLPSPCGLALDTYNGKIYWNEIGGSRLFRSCNLDGSGAATINSGFLAYRLSINLLTGRLYWGDLNYSYIMSMLTGGGSVGQHVGGVYSYSAEVAPTQSAVFYTNLNGNYVERYNYATGARDYILSGVIYPIGLAMGF